MEESRERKQTEEGRRKPRERKTDERDGVGSSRERKVSNRGHRENRSVERGRETRRRGGSREH